MAAHFYKANPCCKEKMTETKIIKWPLKIVDFLYRYVTVKATRLSALKELM
jgi:hypothetical protein